MLYRYVTQYRFDATKACLAKASPGAVSGSRTLLDALNYGSHFPGFQPKVRIRGKQGYRLPLAAAPLYTRQADAAMHLLERHAIPSAGNTSPMEEPPAAPAVAPEPPAFLDEEPVVIRRLSQMLSPLVSSLLAILVAGGVGLAIGHANSFKLRTDEQATASGTISIAPASSTTDSTTTDIVGLPLAPPIAPEAAAAATDSAAPIPDSATERGLALAPELRPSELPQAAPLTTDPLPSKKPKPAVRSARPAKIATPSTGAAQPANRPRETPPQRRPAPSPKPAKPFSDDAPYQVTEATGTIRARYAKCQRLTGIFKRERCAWRLCNNKWGKDGCPSYDHKIPQGIGGTAYAEDSVAGRVMNGFRPGAFMRQA